MAIRPWETLRKVTVTRTPVFSVDVIERRAPDGHEAKFFVARMPDWINVIALTAEEQVVLIRQYRHGTDSTTLEIPGGVVDEGESFLEAAQRELLEETGFESSSWHSIGLVEPNPALQSNRCATLVALDCVPTGQTSFDEDEDIEVVLTDLDRIPGLVGSQEITHALVVAAFYQYEQWRT